MDNNRIKNKSVDISYGEVQEFFNGRASKENLYEYNRVIFQDSEPELALRQDKDEKELILPKLQLKEDSLVLDVGCGVGRWADDITPDIPRGAYIGVDFSSELLKIAQAKKLKNTSFYQGRFQDLDKLAKENFADKLFDVALVNGVCMYINDDDLENCLAKVYSLIKPGGIFYAKESVGKTERLTLKDFYSEELDHSYNAIYRSIADYEQAFGNVFADYKITAAGEVFREKNNNRAETTNYYWIINKARS